MLLRLVNHSVLNKWHVDKMINISGLPEHLFYFKKNGKNFLKNPWAIDVPENIPDYIKAVHQPEPFKVWIHTPSPEKGVPPMEEELDAYGLVLDYQNGLGEDLWLQIERIIDRDTPRGERVPEPIKVADIDNEHRNKPFSVAAADIPVIVLKGFNKEVPETPAVILSSPAAEARPHLILRDTPCPECHKVFKNEQGLRMHKMKMGHAKPVAVGV